MVAGWGMPINLAYRFDESNSFPAFLGEGHPALTFNATQEAIVNIEMPAMIARLFHSVDEALTIWSTRRELANLDDRTLQDLGVSRAQAEFEARRLPWDLPRDRH